MANIQINELSKSLKEYIESLCISVEEITELINTLSAPSNHNHDDNYYTESEINNKLNEINEDIQDVANNLDSGMTEVFGAFTDFQARLNNHEARLAHDESLFSIIQGGGVGSIKYTVNEAVKEEEERAKAEELALQSAIDGKADKSHGTHLTLGTGSENAFRGDYGNTAYNHSQSAHAPSNAQKNSDITKAEIEAKLTGTITSHAHNYAGSSSAGGTANSVNGLTLWTGTQAQYNALTSKSDTTLYFIIE
jgi:hypothetical protein